MSNASSSNPVLVQVLRVDRVESVHRGSAIVVDARGAVVLSTGDVERRVFPRSAVKAIQALPLIESGAAERFGLTDAEIALACASHHGEAAHVETAASMLQKAGRSEATLECGSHWPSSSKAARAMALKGESPNQLHNNCSGKHSGFVCTACIMGTDPVGYVEPQHPAQEAVRQALEDLTSFKHDPALRGTDGCSIPTYDVPLTSLALAFARFATGVSLEPIRAKAALRIRQAMAKAPLMLSGTGNFDTVMQEAFGLDLIAKVGAEGVYCGALPSLGFGVAIKIDDGSMPAAEVVMAALVGHFLKPEAPEQRALVERYTNKALTNWAGRNVGTVRSVWPL